ncbi:hypothetical protein PanWU01x14_315010 [Parasponia andersonii]|uniref:Reverse transcriptase domain-containing protein n=1 Tax=Parasponia andersonii TaxID=3476 RepID=A0A2P5ANV3_PARAD|nr:hypothetical protein PanWU01x14_315010 [Parasponia andersonii]
MLDIDLEVIVYRLKVIEQAKLLIQKRRKFNLERYRVINEEVKKLLKVGFIREVNYSLWIVNIVLIKKANRKWRVCIDFTDLNKTIPNDSFPLSRIDQLVDAIVGHKFLSFMDAYSGYNQICMCLDDEEKTSFITDQGLLPIAEL